MITLCYSKGIFFCYCNLKAAASAAEDEREAEEGEGSEHGGGEEAPCDRRATRELAAARGIGGCIGRAAALYPQGRGRERAWL